MKKNATVNMSDSLKSDIADAVSAMLDNKLQQLVTHIGNMITAKIQQGGPICKGKLTTGNNNKNYS